MAIHSPGKRALPKRRPPGVSRFHGVRMTEEEYLSLPEEKPYLEYADGMVLQKPMPNAEHADIVAELQYHLVAYRKAHGGRTGPERRVRLPGTGYRVPDTAYWAPGMPSGDDSVPTLAVEVRSPGQALAELRAKCRAYRAAGAAICWLIDPAAQTIEVFDATSDGELLAGRVLTAEAMPGFSLATAELLGAG